MEFDDLLKKVYFFDAEIFAHDSLFVFESYDGTDEKVFHNSPADELNQWLRMKDPILIGYNCNSYDKHILRGWLAGFTPEELKELNDYIIAEDGNGWDVEMDYVKIPVMWDLFNEITPKKSLKELEGNLRLDITETTIPFDLPTKWTEEQFQDVLYYCRHDVQALRPIFKMLLNKYKSKFIIAKLGGIEPMFALSQTDANLTAILLGATRQEHDDNFAYKYPDVVDKTKIPKHVLDYVDDLVAHNDLNYKVVAPQVVIDECIIQLGVGGLHGAKETTFIYDKGVKFDCT